MKRISVFLILPVFLFALERVNLIKDHSFEKDSEVWHTRLAGTGFPNVAAMVNNHDAEKAFIGYYSAFCDTRPEPDEVSQGFWEEAFITQGFSIGKKIDDIDSLIINYSIFPINNDYSRGYFAMTVLEVNLGRDDYWKIGYALASPDLSLILPPPYKYLSRISFPEDTFWHSLEKDVGGEIEEFFSPPLSPDASLDSFILRGVGWREPPWRGQKVFFDDIRLMGYADYDVGIKDILSGDGGSPYTPEARIKNFGREPADSFLVIAEISKEETTHYADTMPWSLPADTEDTVSFSTFEPLDTGTYVLRIYTVMEPDESDADDEMSKELDFTAIAEPVTPITQLDMKVSPLCSGDIHVSYALPESYTGTLTLFDLSGRRVDAKQVWGYGSASFNSDLTSGVYFVKLEVSGSVLSRKVVVVE